MFIELLDGSLLNMFMLQDAILNESIDSIVNLYLTNGSIIEEECGSSDNAQERLNTLRSLMTGHLKELKTQVTQLETVVTDSSISLDEINGVVV